ncbi:MAG TPA: glycosyltransferase, partial [Desulfopila sp.]|nr:glycosyltransferase [Desulfopila sp.]
AGAGYHQDVPDLPYAKAMTGLPWHAVMRCRLNGSFDPLIAAGVYATVNTVSENYARELQNSVEDEQTCWLGHHLLDMGTKLEGITNGVDPHAFSPRRGSEIGLAAPFDPLEDEAMAGKAVCKKHLLEQLGAAAPEDDVSQYGLLDGDEKVPLFTFIGRLSAQKGVDILHNAIAEMVGSHEKFQFVILGSGPAYIERKLIVLAEQAQGNICFLSGYNPRLANRIYSAGDFFVIPSRYEPCGLTDYIAQLFANLPVVHHVGGLVKVIDGETGFVYRKNSPGALARTMERAMAAYGDKALIRSMQKKAIETIEKKYTWKEVKKHYLELYKKAIVEQTPK